MIRVIQIILDVLRVKNTVMVKNTCSGKLTCARCGQFHNDSKHEKMACHAPIAKGTTSLSRENVRSGRWIIRKEGNVLFNDALNTFYLRLYGVGHMVKDHSDSERGNPLPPHGLLFQFAARVLLYAPSHRQDSTYHGLCYTSRGVLAGTRNSSMGPPHEVSIRRPIASWANALTTELHLAPYG